MTRSRFFLYFFIITCASVGHYGFATETEELVVQSFYFDYEMRFHVDVPESDTVVTGIDVDKLMKRYIDDYDSLNRFIKPEPDLLVYQWSSNTKGMVSLLIGVYQSHKEAVRRGIIFYSSLPAGFEYDGYERDDRHYTLIKPCHCCVALRSRVSRVYVKNNVIIGFIVNRGPYNESEIFTSILDDIDRGAEGVTIGNQVDLPTIDDSALPDEITFIDDETLQFPINLIEPNDRKVGFWAYGLRYYENRIPGEYYKIISLRVVCDNTHDLLQIQHKGPMETAIIAGSAFNDLNVFSERWERIIKINAPEDSAVLHFSSM